MPDPSLKRKLISYTDEVVSVLGEEMPESELTNGWSRDSWKQAHSHFVRLRDELLTGSIKRFRSYSRDLDFWGVHGGRIFDLCGKIDVALIEYLKK